MMLNKGINASAVGFAPVEMVITNSPGTFQSIAVPAGATSLMAEVIGGGGAGGYSSAYGANLGGGGGGYARRNAFPLSGVTSISVRVGPRNQSGNYLSSKVTANTPSGTVIAEANPGEERTSVNADGGNGVVGDVLIQGQSSMGVDGQGKAAAGPNGLGVAPAGAAGNSNLYGGGGNSSPGPGAQGWVRLTFM